MVENGLYIIKKDFLEIISSLGGDCDMAHGDKRPVFCCLKDEKVDGLYWAIPTSDPSHRDNKHVVMKKQKDISEIQRKFKRVLSMEFRKPNYFKQHITDIRNYLINELNDNN